MISNGINQYDLILDVFSGCAYNCTGCTVQKQVTGEGSLQQDLQQLNELCEDMKASGLGLYELGLGPTDITTATNLNELLNNRTLSGMLHKFEKLIVNTTLLSRSREKLAELADYLERNAPGAVVKLKVPIELSKIGNHRYVEKIKDNLQYFKGSLKTLTLSKVYLVINYKDDIVYHKGGGPGELDVELIKSIYSLEIYDSVNIDLVLPHLRNGTDNLINNNRFYLSLLKLISYFNDLSNNLSRVDETRPIINEVNGHEGYGDALVYSGGVLYFCGHVLDITYIKSDKFALERPWTAENIERQIAAIKTQQLIPSQYTMDCMGCYHLMKCAQRSVLRLKDALRDSRCIGPLGIVDTMLG